MTKKVGLLGLALLALFIAASFYFQLSNGPSRTQTAQLEPYGTINVHLETQPDPPKKGTVPFLVHLTDQNGKPIAVDKVHYTYSFKEHTVSEMYGQKVGDAYQATATLTDVGDWQVHVFLFQGTQQAQISFVLQVMANI